MLSFTQTQFDETAARRAEGFRAHLTEWLDARIDPPPSADPTFEAALIEQIARARGYGVTHERDVALFVYIERLTGYALDDPALDWPRDILAEPDASGGSKMRRILFGMLTLAQREGAAAS
ncbi:MAG: hypothetical protein ACFB2Z_13640 [Maricaulaceae bacterium]